jgi:hypothetical protein
MRREGPVPGNDKYRWAGPTLFTVVLLSVIVFFWWFL